MSQAPQDDPALARDQAELAPGDAPQASPGPQNQDPPDPGEVVDAEIVDSIREIARQEATTIAMSFSGPLPASAEMEGYKRVDPALPARIEEAAREERHHRHKLESRTVTASIIFAGVGHVVGALFVIGALVLGYHAIDAGDPLAGVAAVITAVVPIVLAMLRGGRGGGDGPDDPPFAPQGPLAP